MAITQRTFAQRRKQLLLQMQPNSAAIVPGAREVARSGDTHYPFRQASNFYYLTGFDEPEALLLLIKRVLKSGSKRCTTKTVLFCRDKNPTVERWEGPRMGPKGACQHYGMDEAFPMDAIDTIAPNLLAEITHLYHTLGRCQTIDHHVAQWLNVLRAKARSGVQLPQTLIDLEPLVHNSRLIKSRDELAMMRHAAKLSAKAHRRAMALCKPGLYEYQLEAAILHTFTDGGARCPAYPSIVGAGSNACILHYTSNHARIQVNDLVLIDAGCEYQYYTADITRTFPASGRFSTEQKAIYAIVLAAQLAGIAKVKPGNRWHQIHEATVQVITKGLVSLGLLKGQVEPLIKAGAYRDFYMHRAGHWLGMDVHDVGDYKVNSQWRVLEKGMVMTVEPGIYIAPDHKRVAQKWRGIGVRIEDDVVVTDNGCEILTADVPKTVAEIEALVGSAKP